VEDLMNIAIIARERRRELLVRFCTAYREVFCHHNLFSTFDVSKAISESARLEIVTYMSGLHGGYQQISSKISCGEVDLVLFFRDPVFYGDISQDENDVLRLCDFHSIPLATNVATAEILVHGIERGDFCWQNIGKPAV
jgi:methylglyoxal synthase